MFTSFFIPKRYAPSKAPLVGSACAGTPLDPDSPFAVQKHIRIPLEFRRKGMFVLRVDGDSMTLPDGSGLTHGSLALVNGHDMLTDRGNCYAFRLDDGTLVLKRLNLYRGRPALHSDNPQYSPILLDASIRNLGRVYAYSSEGQGWVSSGYRGL